MTLIRVVPSVLAIGLLTLILLLRCARSIFSSIVIASTDLVAVAITTVLVIYIGHECYWKRRRLPPGPMPWLVFGNMPTLIRYTSMYDLFVALREQYGPIFTFWIGPIPLVMVCDFQLMREYFVKHADQFSGRWRNLITDTFMGGANGVVQIDGEKWREQRRFSLHVLRDFGVGRALIEDKIMTEVDLFIETINDAIGIESLSCTMDLKRPLSLCVGNIIHSVLFSQRFDKDCDKFHRLQALFERQTQLVVRPIMGAYIAAPWLVRIPFVRASWNAVLDIRHELWTFLEEQVDAHRRTFDADTEPTDFTHAYLQEMHRRKHQQLSAGYFSEWQLTMLLLDLLFAGMETTITTLKWGFLYMIINADAQARVHEELDRECGDELTITMKHRSKLPYTLAAINEIQRNANILPMNLLRTVSETTDMGIYHYPKGTLVIPQISVALLDPNVFVDPHRFDPMRFLQSDGKTAQKIEQFIPFSIGKRQCLGESLARAELFLIFANLMHRFRFSIADNDADAPSIARINGLTVSPIGHRMRVERRHR